MSADIAASFESLLVAPSTPTTSPADDLTAAPAPPTTTAAPLPPLTNETILGLERLSVKCNDRGVDRPQQEHKTAFTPPPKLAGNTRPKPLNLVELPVDVLKLIVQEVTHTNDLTNLCLTCRSLHHLAVPQIYSRFDIVWPDAATTGDRVGVDALTHGLATLTNVTARGNNHARWVKKFSLGNGPKEWVSEYNINKEGGKMLGTLVNLAITRMHALETFSWDMPTGILRDVFMSLHDLNHTLKNVHVRFHDNKDTHPPTSQDPSRRVETPTFKGFTGLRSLSVLDVDEPQYLEEMSYAVEASVDTLRELRIGVGEHTAALRRWIRDWDDLENNGASSGSQDGVVGGILGIVFQRIVDLEDSWRKRKPTKSEETSASVSDIATAAVETAEAVVMTSAAPAAVYLNPVDVSAGVSGVAADESVTPVDIATVPEVEDDAAELASDYTMVESAQPDGVDDDEPTAPTEILVDISIPDTESPDNTPTPAPKELIVRTEVTKVKTYEESKPPAQLKLTTLALERVPISVSILVNARAIDWTLLQNLTILNCFHHERLWKALKRRFTPFANQTTHASLSSSHLKNGLHTTLTSSRRSGPAPKDSDYKIRLKKLHTDCVTPVLISFIKETLPPNSLEILFLQEKHNQTNVQMDSIFTAIKRHRRSLKKLLVDSEPDEMGDPSLNYKWTFTKEQLAFVSSGRMPNLKEFGLTTEYKDWHYFLTRLPSMSQLRSLYITHIRETPHYPSCPPRELANQILNTVILRPEIELCYVGILTKCFEILEGPCDDADPLDAHASHPHSSSTNPAGAQDDSEDDEDDGDDQDDDEDDMDDEMETESEGGFEEDSHGKGIRLREILFYDDKVEVFRARNARL